MFDADRLFRLLACIGVAGLAASPSSAQTRAPSAVQQAFWPQLDAYYRLSAHVRLYGIATYTFATEAVAVDNQQYGLNVDFFWKRTRLRDRLRGAEALRENRRQPLQLRIGYRYGQDFNAPEPATENRILTELTGRVVAHAFTLADRNGFDFRWIDGEYSSRYRNRVFLEVPAKSKGYAFTPFADVEWFYSFTDGYWTKVRYEVGVQLPVLEHVSAEPYAVWETYWHSESAHAGGLGINVVLSW